MHWVYDNQSLPKESMKEASRDFERPFYLRGCFCGIAYEQNCTVTKFSPEPLDQFHNTFSACKQLIVSIIWFRVVKDRN